MRVLCIQDSTPIHIHPSIVLVKKDCIYHVTEVIYKDLFGLPKRVWYRLLETGFTVHSSQIFQPIHDDDDEIEEVETIKINEDEQ